MVFEKYLHSYFCKNLCSRFRNINESKNILNNASYDFLASEDYGQNEAKIYSAVEFT